MCYSKRIMSKRLTFEFVKSEIEKGGEEFLSDVYLSNFMLFFKICVQGHKYETDWKRHSLGKRCPTCADIKTGDRCRTEYAFIKSKIQENGEILISPSCQNNKVDLFILCTEKHLYSTTWSNYLKGVRCSKCAGNKPLNLEEVRSRGSEKGLYLNSERYINNSTIMNWSCKAEWHPFPMTFGNVDSDKGCPTCSLRYDKWENQVYGQLILKFPYLKQRIRRLLKTKSFQVDIWDPLGNKAIELDGPTHYKIVYSSEKLEKQQASDLRKNQECLDAGIKLLRVKYSDYMKDPEGSLAKIVEFLS